jgi:hypothetical protein
MQPRDLTPSSFAKYPPQARSLALQQLPLLRDLPPVFVPVLLRELITYDYKLPGERNELEKQLTYLSGLDSPQRAAAMEGFHSITLNKDLATADWVNDPAGFIEKLTASLWSTHQMDRFHSVADVYSTAVSLKLPDLAPATPRLGIVILGAGAAKPDRPLFQKLRSHGVHLTAVKPEDGVATLLAEAERRAAASQPASGHPDPQQANPTFRHWYIDGGAAAPTPRLTQVSYAQLEQPRAHLLARIQQAITSGGMGPEQLRSLLVRLKPADVGFTPTASDEVLNHFQLSLLTEGAGAQIFATTFVQWAARECLRRAQPETLVLRYAPRQQAQTMNMMLSGASPTGTDPAGSLIDADLGAYYTWINMRRLVGAEQLRFLVWFEGQREALAIGPGLPRGTSSDSPLDMHQVLALLH